MNTVKRASFGLLVAVMLMLAWSIGISAEETNYPAVTGIVTLPRIPVVNKEIEFRLGAKDSEGQKADFAIAGEGGKVFSAKVTPKDGMYVARWIPGVTGFYTATFQSGKLGTVKAEFPVVWQQMFFIGWQPASLSDAIKCRYLYQHLCCEEKDIAFLKSQGIKTLGWVGGWQLFSDLKMDEAESIDKAFTDWSAPMKKGYDGIWMDEFGDWPRPEARIRAEREGKTMARLRKEYPDMLMFPCTGGYPLPDEAVAFRDAGAVTLIETYPSYLTTQFATHSVKAYIEQRIRVYRNTDSLAGPYATKGGPLILLGVNGSDNFLEEPSAPKLEDWVRYIKKEGPEMPGIAFYALNWARDGGDLRISETCDRLIHDYYIKPVVDLRGINFSNYTPEVGKPVEVCVEVHNTGGMDARNIKLNVYAKMIGKDSKTKIGEAVIDKIGCGFKRLENPDDKPGFQKVNGNTYRVFPKDKNEYNIVFLARTTVTTKWSPRKKGHYSIIAEVEPSEQYTLLDSVLEQTLVVNETRPLRTRRLIP